MYRAQKTLLQKNRRATFKIPAQKLNKIPRFPTPLNWISNQRSASNEKSQNVNFILSIILARPWCSGILQRLSNIMMIVWVGGMRKVRFRFYNYSSVSYLVFNHLTRKWELNFPSIRRFKTMIPITSSIYWSPYKL